MTAPFSMRLLLFFTIPSDTVLRTTDSRSDAPMHFRIPSILAFLFSLAIAAHAQDTLHTSGDEQIEELVGAFEGLNETVVDMKNVLDAMKKIKVSGYIQTQYQIADTAGVSSFAGGNFADGVKSRFAVRRGRIKVNYDNDLTWRCPKRHLCLGQGALGASALSHGRDVQSSI